MRAKLAEFRARPPNEPLPGKLNWSAWKQSLQNYPDQKFAKYILDGIENGFPIDRTSDAVPETVNRNLPTDSVDAKIAITSWIIEELDKGHMWGPSPTPLIDPFYPSPIGAVPKETNPWTGEILKYRIIHHLSAPRHGTSVNSGVPRDKAYIRYIQFKEVIAMIQNLGVGAWIWKIDLQSAYRQIRVHPSGWHYLGLRWANRYVIDTRFPFGLSSSCRIFSDIAATLLWITVNTNPGVFPMQLRRAIAQYLDDFFGGDSKKWVAQAQYNHFARIAREHGVKTSEKKSFPPRQSLDILGFQYDTVRQTVALPPKKIIAYLRLVTPHTPSSTRPRKRTITIKLLRSIVGKLRHASFVIYPGKAFLRRLDAAVIETAHLNPLRHVNITKPMLLDLIWWEYALRHHNGVPFTFALAEPGKATPIHIITDASDAGIGGWTTPSGQWFRWPVYPGYDLKKFQIDWRELCGATAAIIIWLPFLRNSSVNLWIDNAVAHGWLVSKRPPLHRKHALALLQVICALAAKYSFKFWSNHIPTEENFTADHLSREFSLVPHAILPKPLLESHPNVPWPPLAHHINKKYSRHVVRTLHQFDTCEDILTALNL